MRNKLFILLASLSITQPIFAETCPSPSDIQSGNLNGWSAYTNQDGDPLEPYQLATFEKNVAKFYNTRWLDQAPEGASHCYYTNIYHKFTGAFLSKPGLKPDFSTGNWFYRDTEPVCHAGIQGCAFVADSSSSK